MYVRHAVSMAVTITISLCVGVLVDPTRCPRSLIYTPKRKTGPSLNTVYRRWTENHVFNVMNTASAKP